MAALAFAAGFAVLAMLRHRAFSTGRFDLGNMVQAVWSAANGGLFSTTEVSGEQFSRLGAHVDPILALFAPLWWLWPSPDMLLVVQAAAVASGAVPAYLLGRRWLGDPRLAAAAGLAYLLYPTLQHAVLFDFHPVTLAAPLLMWALWAAEAERRVPLALAAGAAVLCQEQVGLVVAFLALWTWRRHPAMRRTALALGAASLTWVVLCMQVIVPAFGLEGESPFLTRYSGLGSNPAAILWNLVSDPVGSAELLVTPNRLLYLFTLLWPLAFLPLLAPGLALVAAPQFAINLMAGAGLDDGIAGANPIHTIEYHYAVVIAPFMVGAAILGLARLREWLRTRRERPDGWSGGPGIVAGGLVALVFAGGVMGGPLPVWGFVPGGYDGSPLHQFRPDDTDRALREAVALIPDGVPVSATNDAGAHLSARERIMLFPVVEEAEWVVMVDTPRTRAVARDRPTLRPPEFAPTVLRLRTDTRWVVVYEDAGVSVFRRATPLRGEGASAS
ncbi:MAG: DUF2079 domain-containing protein [Miltoncostaeaceae bacterium]